jgi:hypothetical protein
MSVPEGFWIPNLPASHHRSLLGVRCSSLFVLNYESNFRLVHILCISSEIFKTVGRYRCLFPTVTCLYSLMDHDVTYCHAFVT